MQILTVTHFFESHGGGIERVAGHLCRNLAALGHTCIWAASESDSAPADGTVYPLPLDCFNATERLTGLPMPVPGFGALAALGREISRADVVIVHDALYCTSIAAMVIARMKGKPVILIQHIAEIPFSSMLMCKLMALANLLVTRPMIRSADQVVFISETVRQSFAGVKKKRAALLLFNGVDTAIFHPGPALRARFGISKSGKFAVFAGRFVEKKGLAVLKVCAAQSPETTFVLAGSGPIDPHQWNLPNVIPLGTLSPNDVADLFRAADVLLLPSVGEGYPLVIQEAMACGLPVVCGAKSAESDPAAARWLLGTDIDLNEVEETAARVCELLSQQPLSVEERREMGDYAASAYSWRGMATRIDEIFLTIRTPVPGI